MKNYRVSSSSIRPSTAKMSSTAGLSTRPTTAISSIGFSRPQTAATASQKSLLNSSDYKRSAGIFKLYKQKAANDIYEGCPYLQNFHSKVMNQNPSRNTASSSMIHGSSASFGNIPSSSRIQRSHRQGILFTTNTTKNPLALRTLNGYFLEFRMTQEVGLFLVKGHKVNHAALLSELTEPFLKYAKGLMGVYRELQEKIEMARSSHKFYVEIDRIFKEIEELLESKAKSPEFLFIVLKKHAQILVEFRMYKMAIVILKQLKNKADDNQSYLHKAKSYKMLSKCFQIMKKYDVSNIYAIKLLKLSWFNKTQKYELDAYELMGLNAFYKGQIIKARYFHNKGTMGNLESVRDSEVRKLGISSIKTRIDRKEFRRNNPETAQLYTKKQKMALFEGNDVDYYVSSSEDEDEPHFKDLEEFEENEKLSAFFARHSQRPQSVSLNHVKSYGSFEIKMRKPAGKVLSDDFFQDVSERRFLSHLSNNRMVENFQAYDPQKLGYVGNSKAVMDNMILIPEGKSLMNIKSLMRKVEASIKFIHLELMAIVACPSFDFGAFVEGIGMNYDK